MSSRKYLTNDGAACELLLLTSLVAIWLGITVLLGSLSLLVWAGATGMAVVLRPPHQRRRIPESVTDLLSVAVFWCVALGTAGLSVDVFAPVEWSMGDLSWALVAELVGFFLGFVWVLIVLSFQYFEQVVRPFDRPRPAA